MSAGPGSVEEAVELFLTERSGGASTSAIEFAARFEALAPELLSALEALSALESATKLRSDRSWLLPERIGPFRILRELGRGGMGIVLEAIEEPLGRRVALKILPPEYLTSQGALARFRREAELASRLDHSGIATVYVAGIEHERPWIAMRYVEGETLSRKISRARDEDASCVRLSDADDRPRVAAMSVAACIARVSRALQAAHEQGVVHRDVKPSNIMIATDGTPVLVDFGLAIPEESDGNTLTRTGETAGTPSYIAPELVSGERQRPDAQSDVYALGVTLFECLALRRPYEAPTPIALYHMIVSGAPADLRAIRPNLSRDLATIVGMAMERDRGRRYVSAAALAQDLECCVAGLPIAARPVPLSGRILRWARREPKQAVLAMLLILVTVVAGIAGGMWAATSGEVHAAEEMSKLRDSQKRAAEELVALREKEIDAAKQMAAMREAEVERARRMNELQALEMALQEGYGKLATNWLPEAEGHFQRALEMDPRNVEAFAGRAVVALKERRDADVAAILRNAPASPAFDALRDLAAGRPPEVQLADEWFLHAPAVEMFVDGMRLLKQLEAGPRHERKAMARLATLRFDEAVKRSKTARMIYQTERARAASQSGDESLARSAAAALVVLWPDQERALFTAGLAVHPFDERAAIRFLEGAIELDPTWGAPHQVLGNAYMAIEEHDKAERMFRRAIALKRTDADAWNSLGLTLGQGGCTDEARGAYFDAIALRPWMFEAWANLCVLEVKQGNGEDAESFARQALRCDPYEPSIRETLAKCLEDRGALSEALDEVNTIVGFHPKYVPAWKRMARVQAAMGEADAARATARIGLELAPQDAELARYAELDDGR